MKKLSPAALDVIGRIRVEPKPGDGVIAFLPPVQLDRKLYQEVNSALEALGGSWNRKLKGHLFLSDGDLEDALDTVVHTGGFVDRKKLLQFYETPERLADRLIELADIRPGMRILEPSAGHGALIRAVDRHSVSDIHIEWYEIDEKNVQRLKADDYWGTGFTTGHQYDFMAIEPPPHFNRIVMNPPFTKQQDAKHVRHAYDFLAPGGVLVAIMSAAVKFRETESYRWVRDNAEMIEDNDPGAFKESGTMVNTVIVKMCRGE